MTREEFEDFMREDQWTPEQIARWQSMTPVGSAEIVRDEMTRLDGVIEVVRRNRLTNFNEMLKRGHRFCMNWRLLYGLDRLTGHGVISSVIKATICHFGGRTRYHPRWWQRYI